MHPRAEAEAVVRGRFRPRVLEPSPPAVHVPPWFADDPVLGAETEEGSDPDERLPPLLLPVSIGETTWDVLARADPALAGWCADRWLGAWRRLPLLPSGFVTTRCALHAVAEHVLAPARHEANGKIGLRYTRGGFGTPFFADDRQVRISDGQLVVQVGAVEQRAAVTTIRNAAAIAGVVPGSPREVFPPTTPLRPDARLAVEADAAGALGEWFGFAASILEQLRAEATPRGHASRVQLWPEHFDMAVEVGEEHAGQRAAFGASPGDEAHPRPYLYVAPWQPQNTHPFWSAAAFPGAELVYDVLQAETDQRDAALRFFRHGRALLGHR